MLRPVAVPSCWVAGLVVTLCAAGVRAQTAEEEALERTRDFVILLVSIGFAILWAIFLVFFNARFLG